jgi:hypothetical protein
MSNPLFSVNDKPYGKSWSEWSVLWWKWRMPLSLSKDPGYHQYDNNMIFLAYSFNGYDEYQLTIPSGKDLFFPIITAINSYAEDKTMKTDQDLIKWSREDVAKVAKKEVMINGERLEQQQQVRSEPFDIEYPMPNRWNGTPGPTRAICAGYWTFVRSLAHGRYQIRTSGTCLAGTIRRDAAYDLTVI